MDKKEFLLVLFDLNGLKFVNDNYGHLAGDKLIQAFSSNLSRLIGSNDQLVKIADERMYRYKKKIKNIHKIYND